MESRYVQYVWWLCEQSIRTECVLTLVISIKPLIQATENQLIKKKMLDVIFSDLKTNGDGVATYKGVPFTTSAGVCRAQTGLANGNIS